MCNRMYIHMHDQHIDKNIQIQIFINAETKKQLKTNTQKTTYERYNSNDFHSTSNSGSLLTNMYS